MSAGLLGVSPSAVDLDAEKTADEGACIAALLAQPALSEALRRAASTRARDIILKARGESRRSGVIETFLEEFGLANREGLALMCLAEALLRVPDAETADALIAEKIASGDWGDHRGRSDSALVNASTWGLMLTGRLVQPPDDAARDPAGFVRRMAREAGEPVIRAAMMQAMRIMGEQFVLGRTIKEALRRSQRQVRRGEAAAHSFDMLGEGARTAADAQRYFESYADAIGAVGHANTGPSPETASGVSVKLSALNPAYRDQQAERIHRELYPMLLALARQAAAANINLTLDAEEADRLTLSLGLLERVAGEAELGGWTGLGLALQAYQKRSLRVVAWLKELAVRRRLMVRLVKGAYWDAEVKRAQIDGQPDYPVFTTKPATDVSYLASAKALIDIGPAIYPQFATHNAHTLASVEIMINQSRRTDFEFQRLHGMGAQLYGAAGRDRQVRVYAPVGAHQDLLPYLVRRLLENGANTSFVHAFLDEDVPADFLARDPYALLAAAPSRHPRLPTPPDLFGARRRNSKGCDLTQTKVRRRLEAAVRTLDAAGPLVASPLIAGRAPADLRGVAIRAPADAERTVGRVIDADDDDIGRAFTVAAEFQPAWNARGGPTRAAHLRAMADSLEGDADRFVALCAREAGKTLDDGVAEVREAVDFCRYYAAEAEAKFDGLSPLPGPAGETNGLELLGRGVFVCISPWNFPLAIFTGQIAAALAAGNAVIAKPAEQTPLIAFEAVKAFRRAGLPSEALQLTTGPGEVGAKLIDDPRCSGVAFTGSTEVARTILRQLAAKTGPIVPLIAETGGLNAMFCDTTALKEQVVDDVVASAFHSAGQRCSALRVLFLPHETADEVLEMLEGALAALTIGDPADAHSDVGPVIDRDAQAALEAHLSLMRQTAKVRCQRDLGDLKTKGSYFGPAIVELGDLGLLTREVFGPILHVVRYDPDQIEEVGAAFSAKGYGLTLGVHSRLEGFVARVKAAVRAGNVYVNRSIIGAVVGVQPFGGLGLSGTGPKAGGPHYLERFGVERTVTVNIAAQGGDPGLLNL